MKIYHGEENLRHEILEFDILESEIERVNDKARR
jgi:hypothetical protein